MLSDVGGGSVASVLDVQSLFFYSKKNWMSRLLVEPLINILLTRNYY